jgi:hypothetical protein
MENNEYVSLDENDSLVIFEILLENVLEYFPIDQTSIDFFMKINDRI